MQVHSSRESSSAASAAALSRVTEQVNKDLLICYVVRPKSLGNLVKEKTNEDNKTSSVPTDCKDPSTVSATPVVQMKSSGMNSQADDAVLEAFLNSPNCVKKFRVKEVMKKRWIMDTERDQTKGLLLSMRLKKKRLH